VGAVVKCSACDHQTRYDSSEIIERSGQWVIECAECGNFVSIGKAELLENQVHEAMKQ
jgi:uncharacterized Zn finger protein